MKTITEIRDYLLENYVDRHGDLRLPGLDFSDFDGNVFINDMIVKRDLYQNGHEVQGDLYQNTQIVKGYLYQSDQVVAGKRYEDLQPNNISFEAKDSPNDLINSPNHYIGDNGLEVEQILREFLPRIKDAYVAHRIGSAIEYILRSPLKNGTQDYQKAIKNLEQALEHLGSDEE